MITSIKPGTRPAKPGAAHRDPRKTHDLLGGGNYYDAALIATLRLRLPEYLEKLDVELNPSGERLVGLCPGHNDTNPSFAVFGDDHAMCGCYPCDFTGDIFALAMFMERATTFPEAVGDVCRVLGVAVPQIQSRPAPLIPRKTRVKANKPKYPPFLIHAIPILLQEARDRFANAVEQGDEIIGRIAGSIGIPVETLAGLAGPDSCLGLSDSWLCYVYPEGLKWRNPAPKDDDPRFLWLQGRATMPWRGDRITAETETVYLTEGETDCLALIDAGLEADGKTVCVASPGTSFPRQWASHFNGKRVVLCFDADQAGQTAMLRVAAILKPHASSIETFNLFTPDEHCPN